MRRLDVVPGTFAVCRLAAETSVPAWSQRGPLYAVTRTPDELSIVCDAAHVPGDVPAEGPWRAFRVAGTLDFALTGILHDVLDPLADAGISVFALSTFDTDYVLVRAERLAEAAMARRGVSRAGRQACVNGCWHRSA